MTEESKAAAEDYRHQRQAAEARRNGFEYNPASVDEWLAHNEPMLRSIIEANNPAGMDVEQALDDYKAYLAAASPGSALDDKNARAILDPILKNIDDLCSKAKIPVRNGVVYGVAPAFGLLAAQREVMATDVSIIEVSIPFLVFCNSISKVLARSIPHKEGPMIEVCHAPDAVLAKLRASPELMAEWSFVVAHYASGWLPPNLSPAPDRFEQVTRIFILKAMEWFALAHEFGHHVMKHGKSSSTVDDRDDFDIEHEADLFARGASIVLGGMAEPQNMYAICGVGGVVVLGMADLVRRARNVLATGDDTAPPREHHPPFADRVAVFALLDQHLPEQIRSTADGMRTCFLAIIDGIWNEILPMLKKLHYDGAQPPAAEINEQGWLLL